MSRDFHLPGRSPAMAGEAMVATSHPLATAAALACLRAGGTAADAAVTAVAVLCVVEPHMTGIGGDCFCLVAPPGAKVRGYNGSGRAGAEMRAETLIERGVTTIGMDSVHAVTVPGALQAWEAVLAAHGRFDLARALEPAIRYAENGFPVAPRVAFDWALYAERLRRDAGAARHFLLGGQAPAAGDVMRFPALAQTLRDVARHGSRAFYEGPIAEEIAATLAARGGLLTPADLAAHRGGPAEPIEANYRGLDVVELPPNGQGLAALLLLNIFENFDFAAMDRLGAERLHLAVEAARLAYGVRDAHIADPAHMRTTVETLLDKQFARALAGRLDPARRVPLPEAPTPGSDTVYLTVVDRDRMAVSFINSTLVSAGTIIPIAERLGLIRLLDHRVLELVVAELLAYPSLQLSLNVSPASTVDPTWWASLTASLRAHAGLAERLTVEITEMAEIHDIDETRGFVSRVKDLGCRIAIDDFGAGFTSFRNLRKLGVDIIKIDGAFVQNLTRSQDDRVFVRTMVELGRSLGLITIAEWVQSEEAAAMLREWGCDYLQGALIGLASTERRWTHAPLSCSGAA